MLEHAPLEAVYIYFDTASYDQIERDEKVMVEASHSHCMFTKKWSEGDSGRDDRINRWHHGSSHWLLHSQWGWNRVLSSQVLEFSLIPSHSSLHVSQWCFSVSQSFLIWRLSLLQVLHVVQDAQIWRGGSSQREIWEPPEEERLMGSKSYGQYSLIHNLYLHWYMLKIFLIYSCFALRSLENNGKLRLAQKLEK